MSIHDIEATVPPAPSDEELKALYDDPYYGNGDVLASYMSMRDNGPRSRRQQYLESLKPELRERLMLEINRIAKLRAMFFANLPRKPSQNLLQAEGRIGMRKQRNSKKKIFVILKSDSKVWMLEPKTSKTLLAKIGMLC